MEPNESGDARSDGGELVTVTDERSPGERVALSVTRAVACVLDTDPLQLSPLYETVDPDALDRLFDGTRRRDDGALQFSFRYEGCAVALYADGRTVVEPIGELDATDSSAVGRQ